MYSQTHGQVHDTRLGDGGGGHNPSSPVGRCCSHSIDLGTWRWRQKDLKFQASLNDLARKTLSQQPPNQPNKRQKAEKRRGREELASHTFHFHSKYASSVFRHPRLPAAPSSPVLDPTPSHPKEGKTQARKWVCEGEEEVQRWRKQTDPARADQASVELKLFHTWGQKSILSSDKAWR